MPDTAWPIDRHPPGSSRDTNVAPVSMPPILFRHLISGSLALAFVIHTCRARSATFPATLTTTALDRGSSGWFAAPACTAAAEGHQTRRPGSSISCTAPHPVIWSSTSSLLQRSCSHQSSRSSTTDGHYCKSSISEASRWMMDALVFSLEARVWVAANRLALPRLGSVTSSSSGACGEVGLATGAPQGESRRCTPKRRLQTRTTIAESRRQGRKVQFERPPDGRAGFGSASGLGPLGDRSGPRLWGPRLQRNCSAPPFCAAR
jgi:hypothetical protein